MGPDPVLWLAPDGGLDGGRVPGGVLSEIHLAIAGGGGGHRRLEADHVPLSLPVDEAHDHRRPRPQREGSGTGRRPGLAAEERDEVAGSIDVDVDQHPQNLSSLQGPEDLPGRRGGVPLNRLDAVTGPGPHQQAIHPRVRQLAGDDVEGQASPDDGRRHQLPAPHVTRDQDGAPTRRQRILEMLEPLEPNQCEQPIAIGEGEPQRLDEVPTQPAKDAPAQGSPLSVRVLGKGDRQVLEHALPRRPGRPVGQSTQSGAAAQGPPARHRPQDALKTPQEPIADGSPQSPAPRKVRQRTTGSGCGRLGGRDVRHDTRLSAQSARPARR